MNFYSVSVRKSLSVLFILGASLVLCSEASTLNELDDGEFVEMKPPLESAVDYYDKFYTSFNRFTRDVPLLHFRRNYATENDNEDSQEIEHSREKRQVKFVDNDSPSSKSSPSRSPSSGKRDFETESNAATLAFGPASLTVSAGNAKHYPGGGFGGYPILGGGGYYPGGGYPGGGYHGGGYPGGGYGEGVATATATATAGGVGVGGYPGGGYGGYPGGGGYYPGGGYGGYGGYPGGQLGGQGNNGGGYFGGYPGGYGGGYGGYGGGYGGYRPGFGGGLYSGFGGFGPYGYGRNSGDSKDNAENDDTPLKRGSGKQSASASSPSSSKPGSSAVKFSSN